MAVTACDGGSPTSKTESTRGIKVGQRLESHFFAFEPSLVVLSTLQPLPAPGATCIFSHRERLSPLCTQSAVFQAGAALSPLPLQAQESRQPAMGPPPCCTSCAAGGDHQLAVLGEAPSWEGEGRAEDGPLCLSCPRRPFFMLQFCSIPSILLLPPIWQF